MEVKAHKFQKALLQMKFTGPDNLFTFYEKIRHIAGSFNILLCPLMDITRQTGICALTSSSFLGYDNLYNVMSSAIYLKFTSNDY